MRTDYAIELTWTDFKDFLTRTSSAYYWVQSTGTYYHVIAQQGCLVVRVEIAIDDPATAEQLDFETNYKK